jgi:predicted GH43/DUF377 family glycosyl hydrolase
MKHFFTVLIFFLQAGFLTNSIAQVEWIKDPANPIPLNGESSTWNRHVFFPNVLYNADSSCYEMWFSASVGQDNPNWRPYRIGFATSQDGISWAMHPDPVLKPEAGTWDESTIDHATVLRENGEYKMWYTSWSQTSPEAKIGYATSTDGKTWQKHADPIMGPGTRAWEDGGVGYCTVMPVQGGGYKMWYSGLEKPVLGADSVWTGYATSEDGISWQRMNNPVLTPGSPEEWDEAMAGATQVHVINDKYYMWYVGNRINLNPRHTGLALSSNGVDWIKYNDASTENHPYAESDPVLSPSSGQWDGNFAEAWTILLNRTSDSLYMWYDGSRVSTETNLWRIGLARLPIDTLITLDISDNSKPYKPKNFSLSQNYPNPFNPSTRIEFTLSRSELVQLQVYNIKGQEIQTLLNKKMPVGRHRVEFNGDNLSSGIYLYRIHTSEFQDVKKMVLLK